MSMMHFKSNYGYRVPGRVLSIRLALTLLVFEVAFGVFGFWYIENYSVLEAWYMTIITISTVGYTEAKPLSPSGELFATILILANIGIFAYLLAAFSYYVVQGELFKNLHLRLVRKQIGKLKDHIIVCGYGRHGQEIVDHFIIYDQPFIVVDSDPDTIVEIQNNKEKILYLEGDATQDELLIAAGVKEAKALITSLPSDADNVLVTLSARQLNPGIDIISRAAKPNAEAKLMRAGADHVVLPEQIGGFIMATLVNKPGAIEFLSYVTNEKDMVDIAFEEIHYENLPAICQGKTIGELNISQSTGTHIIGFIGPEGNFVVNPGVAQQIVEGSTLITLGTRAQLDRLQQYLLQFENGASL